jgi:hypothetical protein
MARDTNTQAGLEDRDMREMRAALESEKRDGKERELRAALENEKRDSRAALEKEKREMRAALESEKRDGKEREMRAALESEKRDRQVERKDLEQKLELMKMQTQAALEKKDVEQQMTNIAVRAEIEKVTRNVQHMELRQQLKQEQKDRKVQRQLQELQHLVESQHSVHQRPLALQSSAAGNMQQRARQAEIDAATAATQAQFTRREADRQKEIEDQMIRARAEGAALTKTFTSPPVHKQQQPIQTSTSQEALLPEANGHQAPVQADMRRQIVSDKQQTHTSKTATQAAALLSSPVVPESIAQPPSNSKVSKQNTAKQQEVRMSKQQQSHTRAVKSRVKTGAVRLPGGVASHFFLSHCQSTGGDQTNAIYLELRQMGFTCWYCNYIICTYSLYSLYLVSRR